MGTGGMEWVGSERDVGRVCGEEGIGREAISLSS